MIAPPPLRAVDVTVRVGRQTLLDHVSVTAPPRSMTVLLGPNGAGKSTLIRILAGVLTPSAGAVYLGEQRLDSLSRSAMARECAYLPQHTATVFDLRVEDAVALGRYPHLRPWGGLGRVDYQRISWAIERAGLGPLRRRTLPTLSGGERQRVFIARALAQEAPILLLDEPITALDVGRQFELMELLAGLHQDGHTILAALHDLRPAVDFFPQAILLDRGRLVAEGPTRAIVHGPELATAFGVQVSKGEGLVFTPLRRPGAV